MNGYCSTCGAEWHGTPFCTACGKRMLPEEPPGSSFVPSPGLPVSPSPGLPAAEPAPAPLAPLGARFLALALDEAVIHALAWLVAMVAVGAYRAGAGFLPEADGAATGWWMALSCVLGAAWHTVFLGSGGQTPGKRLLGVRVTRENGAPLGYGRAFLRTICYPLSLFPFGLGFLWAAWDPRRQAWHDKLAGTVAARAER